MYKINQEANSCNNVYFLKVENSLYNKKHSLGYDHSSLELKMHEMYYIIFNFKIKDFQIFFHKLDIT